MGKGVLDKRVYFIVNAKAGGGRARRRWQTLLAELEKLDFDFFWEHSLDTHSISAQVRDAVVSKGAEVVIVVGGDGSLHGAVNGLVEDDRLLREDLILGVYPAGSACDFVRDAYGGSFVDLPRLLQEGCFRKIDLGCCDYHDREGQEAASYYINSFDAGAGADTCYTINADCGRIKRLLRSGRAAFLLTALYTLMTFSYTNTVVETDEGTVSGKYIIIGAGNGRFCGGAMQLYPQALLDDGKLDLLLVEKRSRPEILRIFHRVYDGSFIREKDITYLRTKGAHISTVRPVPVELDGEVPGFTPVKLRVLPSSLTLLVPSRET